MNPETGIGQTVFVADGTKITAYRVARIATDKSATGVIMQVYADQKASNRELHLVGYYTTEKEARDAVKAKAKAAYDKTCADVDASPLDNSFL